MISDLIANEVLCRRLNSMSIQRYTSLSSPDLSRSIIHLIKLPGIFGYSSL